MEGTTARKAQALQLLQGLGQESMKTCLEKHWAPGTAFALEEVFCDYRPTTKNLDGLH